jgi:acetolactate synthase-1/2/3 large subunit
MFGIPGGEILHFIDAARREGIEFILTRDESTAAFMADVTGQIQRAPGVCVSTLGPGAVNMTLGVANAYLDRSPLIAITASLACSSEPYATHQNLDLNAIYRPFTKLTITLDGQSTAAKVREAYDVSVAPRMGPVHIALPSDVACRPECDVVEPADIGLSASAVPPPAPEALEAIVAEIRAARRPVVIVGLDVDPYVDTEDVRAFVEHLGAPAFVTPKAKGILAADHPLFCGVCAGVAGDAVIVDFFSRADLLIGIGFEPVESDKLWHHSMKLVSVGPVSIAAGSYRPHREAVGNIGAALAGLARIQFGPFDWNEADLEAHRRDLEEVLRPAEVRGRGLSPSEVTRRLRGLMPRDTVLAIDVGSNKSVTSQCWDVFDPLTFFESNGLSSMSYGFAGAMAAKLAFPHRHVLCTIGDGGFGMTLTEIETCVRRRIHFITVVYNDNSLSLIKVSQGYKGLPTYGVDYCPVNFAAVADAFGAWSRRVNTLDELTEAIEAGLRVDRPVVIDVAIDPTEYRVQNAPDRMAIPLPRS